MHHKMKMKKKKMKTLSSDPPCTNSFCFFCIMNEPNPLTRKSLLLKCFKEMPEQDSQEHVLALSGIWKIAMTRPNNPEFPSLGIFSCLAKFINRGVTDLNWLQRGQNIYIPYYAAHVIGSYAMNEAHFAEIAAESGVVPPLMELLRGRMSWVEQRVAVRALAHLGSHERSFEAIAGYELEIVKSAMEIASNCVDRVYSQFVGLNCGERKKYQCDLLTRGLVGSETEDRKAEEWASQLQSWSLSLLDCFARKERCIEFICEKKFLNKLGSMWGGLTNRDSPGGIGLIRTLCNTNRGRYFIANSNQVMDSLCNLSRSIDDQRDMVIESILLILKDPETRFLVLDRVVPFLADLVEARNKIWGRRKTGDVITQALLQDYSKIKYGKMKLKSERAQRAMEDIWELKLARRKREKLMSEQEIRERKAMVGKLKKKGNERFWSGEIEEAIIIYDKALFLCRLKMRRERIVLYSNRAQCFLLMKKPEMAISDATRALCLSGEARPHRKSLWRRSQAYDMIGLARESLMDCLMFINGGTSGGVEKKGKGKIPYYAVRMISKQMNATWIFGDAKLKKCEDREEFEKSMATVE